MALLLKIDVPSIGKQQAIRISEELPVREAIRMVSLSTEL
jgi:hypothetical protein